MEARLEKACLNLTRSKGGLNVDDLKYIAHSRGVVGASKMSRKALLEVLCAPAAVATSKATSVVMGERIFKRPVREGSLPDLGPELNLKILKPYLDYADNYFKSETLHKGTKLYHGSFYSDPLSKLDPGVLVYFGYDADISLMYITEMVSRAERKPDVAYLNVYELQEDIYFNYLQQAAEDVTYTKRHPSSRSEGCADNVCVHPQFAYPFDVDNPAYLSIEVTVPVHKIPRLLKLSRVYKVDVPRLMTGAERPSYDPRDAIIAKGE
jgi:hypothetical protein